MADEQDKVENDFMRIIHRTYFLPSVRTGTDIHHSEINEALLDGWKIVSYLSNVSDDSSCCGEPGSVSTNIEVVLAKQF